MTKRVTTALNASVLHYYLLGYSPVLTKRELHQIEVSVGGPGVRVRSRLSRG